MADQTPSEQKTRWQKLLETLRSRGWTQGQIQDWLAEKGIKVGQATLSDLFRGVTLNPNFELGAGLQDLHDSGELPVAEKDA